MLKLVGVVLLLVIAFYVGVGVGIADCKRRFNLARGEMPNDASAS